MRYHLRISLVLFAAFGKKYLPKVFRCDSISRTGSVTQSLTQSLTGLLIQNFAVSSQSRQGSQSIQSSQNSQSSQISQSSQSSQGSNIIFHLSQSFKFRNLFSIYASPLQVIKTRKLHLLCLFKTCFQSNDANLLVKHRLHLKIRKDSNFECFLVEQQIEQ